MLPECPFLFPLDGLFTNAPHLFACGLWTVEISWKLELTVDRCRTWKLEILPHFLFRRRRFLAPSLPRLLAGLGLRCRFLMFDLAQVLYPRGDDTILARQLYVRAESAIAYCCRCRPSIPYYIPGTSSSGDRERENSSGNCMPCSAVLRFAFYPLVWQRQLTLVQDQQQYPRGITQNLSE